MRRSPLRLPALTMAISLLILTPHSHAQRSHDPKPACGYRVVRAFPHDPDAFTQGFVYFGKFFYESTGLRGKSTLRKVVPETGAVVQEVKLPNQYFGEGLARVRDRLVQLTWRSRTGFVYDLSTFRLIKTFTYPTEGWGLTFDGSHLIMSDGTSFLYRIDPDTLTLVDRFQVLDDAVPVHRLNELEFVEGEILANVWYTDEIVRIDPETGMVKGRIGMAGILDPSLRTPHTDVLNGIAWDPEEKRLFVTGKNWPRVFEIHIREPGTDNPCR